MKPLYKLFFLCALVAVFTVTQKANAATFAIGNPNGAGSVYVSAQLDKTVYAPGETIRVNAQMLSQSPLVSQVSLEGGANGTLANVLNQFITNGQWTSIVSRDIGSAQNTPGSYNASFTGGYNITTPSPTPVPVSVYLYNGYPYNNAGHGCLVSVEWSVLIPQDVTMQFTWTVNDRWNPRQASFTVVLPANTVNANSVDNGGGRQYCDDMPEYTGGGLGPGDTFTVDSISPNPVGGYELYTALN